MTDEFTHFLSLFYRCIAVNSIGIFLYEELSHGILESKYVEAVNVLLGTLRVRLHLATAARETLKCKDL